MVLQRRGYYVIIAPTCIIAESNLIFLRIRYAKILSPIQQSITIEHDTEQH